MRKQILFLLIALAIVAPPILVSTIFFNQEPPKQRPIVIGETEGWSKGKLAVFEYTQNFICADSPLNEHHCRVGMEISPDNPMKLDPKTIVELMVIVPFFDADGDGLLEALDPTPGVFVQCPETQSSALAGGKPFGIFGHCILHDTMLDTSKLSGTKIAGFTFSDQIPLPNHIHLIQGISQDFEPWKAQVVLVLDPRIWPEANGSCPAGTGCLTSFDAIRSAPKDSIVGPIPTTLVLFFTARELRP